MNNANVLHQHLGYVCYAERSIKKLWLEVTDTNSIEQNTDMNNATSYIY